MGKDLFSLFLLNYEVFASESLENIEATFLRCRMHGIISSRVKCSTTLYRAIRMKWIDIQKHYAYSMLETSMQIFSDPGRFSRISAIHFIRSTSVSKNKVPVWSSKAELYKISGNVLPTMKISGKKSNCYYHYCFSINSANYL